MTSTTSSAWGNDHARKDHPGNVRRLLVTVLVLLGLAVLDMIDQYTQLEQDTAAHRAAAERSRLAVEHDHPTRIAATRGSDLAPEVPRGTP